MFPSEQQKQRDYLVRRYTRFLYIKLPKFCLIAIERETYFSMSPSRADQLENYNLKAHDLNLHQNKDDAQDFLKTVKIE